MDKSSIETIKARLLDLHHVIDSQPGGYSLFELSFLQLEADAWPLALRSVAGRQLLIELYAAHSQNLSTRQHMNEAGIVANRAIGLMGTTLKPARPWMYSVIVSARARGFGGEHSAPKRGFERLVP